MGTYVHKGLERYVFGTIYVPIHHLPIPNDQSTADQKQIWRPKKGRELSSNLREFIGYADSTDFCEISPEHSRDNNEPKNVGKF